jgi:hypothetical protein
MKAKLNLVNTTLICILFGSIALNIFSMLISDPIKNAYLNDLYGLTTTITIPFLFLSIVTNFSTKIVNVAFVWIILQSLLGVSLGSNIVMFDKSYLDVNNYFDSLSAFIMNNTIIATFYLANISISLSVLFNKQLFRNVNKSFMLIIQTFMNFGKISDKYVTNNYRFKLSTYITKRIVISSILIVMMTSGTILPFMTSSANAASEASKLAKPTEDNPYPLSIIPPGNEVRQKCLDDQFLPSDKIAKFNVHAISVDIVYNSFGQHDPDGRMYVLEEDKSRIEQQVRSNPGKTVTDVQPLVIRSNFGECVEIKFTNDLENEYASIHTFGLGLDPNKSDGMAIGVNKDTTVAPGQSITYRWFPDKEGAYFFSDGAREINRLSNVDGVLNSIAQKHIHHTTPNAPAPAVSDAGLLGEWQKESQSPNTITHAGLLGEWQKQVQFQNGNNNNNNNNGQQQGQEEEEMDNNVLPSLRQRGLFGALVVEPPNATWTHPITGKELKSGVRADVHFPDPVRPDAREFIIFYHDGPEVVNRDGSELIDLEGEPYSLHPINYRGDPIPERFDPDNCPPGVDVEVCTEAGFFYSSWVHGEPGGGDLIFPAYKGDPLRFIVIGANQEENHVHHLHHHRWKSQNNFEPFNTIDSNMVPPGKTFDQPTVAAFGDGTVRPSMSFAQALIAGAAGYTVKDQGDVLFHCHLFPHYGTGMWGILRVLDKINSVHFERTSEGELKAVGDILQELPDRKGETPKPTKDQPGFPFFIPVNDDGSPKSPPDPNGVGRDYTEKEWKATNYYKKNPNSKIGEGAAPGAPISNPCPDNAKVRHYDVTGVNRDIVYNKYGDHDPFARFFVLEQEKKQVLADKEKIEPLLLRTNVGDCIETTFKNELSKEVPLPVQNPEEEPTDLSMHIHFVAFDLLGSDGVSTGYNYRSWVEPGEEISYRWYADEEGNVFWHDHASGIERGMHGTFGELLIEPKNSQWLHPITGKPIITGSEAIIAPQDGKSFQSFREFALVYQDFTELFDKNGTPINFEARDDEGEGDVVNRKLPKAGSFEDHGVMGINYRNEPLYHRIENAKSDELKDPAYLFSSWAHGDPSTPLFKAYSNDPIKVRLLTGAHEEQHNLKLHGLPVDPGPEGRGVQAQTVGVSEQFTFDVMPESVSFEMIPSEMVNTQSGEAVTLNAISARNDYLYSSHASDDTWNGMWGIIRVWCDPNAANADGVKLFPLPGVKQVSCSENTDIESTVDSKDLTNKENLDTPNDDRPFANKMEEDRFTGNGDNRGFNAAEDDKKKLTDNRGTIFHSVSDIFEMDERTSGNIYKKYDHGKIKEYAKTMFSNDQQRLKPMGVTPPFQLADLLKDQGSKKLETYVDSRCSDDSRINSFDVTAFAKDIKYNRYGDHDPHGIVFALDEDVKKIKEGKKSLEPLVLRANMGDCIIVKLTNSLPESYGNDHDNHRHPLMPVECSEHLKVACFDPKDYPTSNRVSLHDGEVVNYDVNLFDGANVGFNAVDQTVAPGESFVYVWFADRPGTAVLDDMADLRGHRHHGAYASLVIGAEGSSYFDPETHKPIKAGAVADVVVNNANDNNFGDKKKLQYRDFSILMGDGMHIVNPTDLCVVPIEEEDPTGTACNQSPVNDQEEQGFVTINYKSAPLFWRLLLSGFYQIDDDELRSKIIAQVFSSKIHGDPDTPVFKAKEGTPVAFRVSDVGDKPRGFNLHIPGHLFVRAINTEQDISDIFQLNLAKNKETPIVVEPGATEALSPGRAHNLVLVGGAGGLQDKPGDYIYQENKLDKYLEAGAWGIFRVEDDGKREHNDKKERKDQKSLLPEIKAEIRDIADDIRSEIDFNNQEQLQFLATETERYNRLDEPTQTLSPSPLPLSVYNDDLYETRDKEFDYNMN